MSQDREPYGESADYLNEFPEPFRAALRLIEQHRRDDVGMIIHAVIAALVHPDCVCNLALLSSLPAEAKEAVLQAFAYCLENALSPAEQGLLARRLFPS